MSVPTFVPIFRMYKIPYPTIVRDIYKRSASLISAKETLRLA